MVRVSWTVDASGQRIGRVGGVPVATVTPIPGDAYFRVTAGPVGGVTRSIPGRLTLREAIRKATNIVAGQG